MFETHRDFKNTSWHNTTLLSVITDLDKEDFDCYWGGTWGHTYSLTHCWETAFESKGWGNVVCARRGDVWWQSLERYDPNSVTFKR